MKTKQKYQGTCNESQTKQWHKVTCNETVKEKILLKKF